MTPGCICCFSRDIVAYYGLLWQPTGHFKKAISKSKRQQHLQVKLDSWWLHSSSSPGISIRSSIWILVGPDLRLAMVSGYLWIVLPLLLRNWQSNCHTSSYWDRLFYFFPYHSFSVLPFWGNFFSSIFHIHTSCLSWQHLVMWFACRVFCSFKKKPKVYSVSEKLNISISFL